MLDSPKCFYSFSCENARSPLSLSPAPLSFRSFESLPSEALDWKHALFNHRGDSPCPVFAPLPCCNNKKPGHAQCQLQAWHLQEGARAKKVRWKERKTEGGPEEGGVMKAGTEGERKRSGKRANVSTAGRTSASATRMEELKLRQEGLGCCRES